jgi:transcriptional regulator of heat shock response
VADGRGEKQRLVRMLTNIIDGRTDGGDRRRAQRSRIAAVQLVAATYFDGRSNGTVGIIGPTRMRYSKRSRVDIAAIAVARGVARRQLFDAALSRPGTVQD